MKVVGGSVLALWAVASFVLVFDLGAAPTPIDEDSPWPRRRSTNGYTVTLHLPQVESWTSNSFTARAAVELKPPGAKTDLLGVVWFAAHGSVDRSNRIVTLDRMEITRGSFPTAPHEGSNALAIVRSVLPGGARTVSLDYLTTALGFVQAAARQGASGLKHTPPEIIWATNRAVLILIDGEPVLRPVAGTTLQRVINTPALIVQDTAAARFYLAGADRWFAAAAIKGPWGPVESTPQQIAALSTNQASAEPDQPPPKIIISTTPAELLMTSGLPEHKPIKGTGLSYVADSDNLIFFQAATGEAYVLLSGRWFKAKSLHGPWTYVPPNELPSDFARIPAGSPQAIALASVPGTPQAELAVLANSVPVTATVNRREATLDLKYDGEPKFKSIEGTKMRYAVNAPMPVIKAGESYYALDNGVWFVATSPTGPWEVATEVPEEIYSIPPSSPVYYATFARVYQADEDEVEVGYTPGYQGAFEDNGTVVYGTGWDYEPYYGDDYYGWGWTWGYSYVYVPWYEWWVWRPWWNEQGGLRAAMLENIYDRWQGRNGVVHHDQSTRVPAADRGAFAGYPTMYGRFRGASRPAELAPPATAIALNPYARPRSAVRQGEIPHGAQLLTTVRQAPRSGRDLYASPDGNVYMRKDNGWYQKSAGDTWRWYAPATSGTGFTKSSGALYKPNPDNYYKPGTGTPQASGFNRVPNTGAQARAQDVAALEREYAARNISRMRAQN